MALLDGRVALVTVAAGAGIGQATARRLLEEGADVVVTDAHARRVQEVAAALSEEFGREVLGLENNVTNREQADGPWMPSRSATVAWTSWSTTRASTSSSPSGR